MALIDFSASWTYILLGIILLALAAKVIESRKAGLDSIPGPFLARYTDAWRAYQAWKINHYSGRDNYQTALLHQYGDVVRIGPKTVLVIDPEAIPTVLGFKERLNKGPGYRALAMTGTNQTALVGIPDEDTHGKFRRPIAHAYSLSSLKGYESYIDDTLQTLTDVLAQRAESGEPINMSEWLHYWAFDVVSKISFGKPLGFLEHGNDFNGMIRAQKAAFRYISIVNNWPVLDSWLKRNRVLNYFKATKPAVFLTFSRRTVAERQALLTQDPEANRKAIGSGANRYPDLLGSFIAAQPQYPDIMSDDRIAHYSQANVVAGANNSALSMARSILYFAQQPAAWERLHREVGEANIESLQGAETEGPVALDLAFKIPYLEAVVTESLRTSAVASNNLDRVAPAHGVRLPDGTQLPAGTTVAINTSAMMRRADVFGEEVSQYNPLRWMQRPGEPDESFRERRAKMDRAMIAFGYGSRGCIGKNIVMLELYKIWASLVRNFTWEPIGEPELHSVMVRVHKRAETEAIKA